MTQAKGKQVVGAISIVLSEIWYRVHCSLRRIPWATVVVFLVLVLAALLSVFWDTMEAFIRWLTVVVFCFCYHWFYINPIRKKDYEKDRLIKLLKHQNEYLRQVYFSRWKREVDAPTLEALELSKESVKPASLWKDGIDRFTNKVHQIVS